MSTGPQRKSRASGPQHAVAWLLACAVLLPLATQAASPSGQPGDEKHYSWVDKNGERHYGDAVPPEYAQTERRVLNNQGIEVDRVEAVKNAQQVAEQKRLEQDVASKAQHDRFLLTTYTSTRDIERLRDERLDQINGQIRATNSYVESLQGRIDSLQVRALRFKPYNTRADARRMPDDLAEELVRTTNEVRTQRRSLENRVHEQDSVRTQFEADIKRFRELTANNQRG